VFTLVLMQPNAWHWPPATLLERRTMKATRHCLCFGRIFRNPTPSSVCCGGVVFQETRRNEQEESYMLHNGHPQHICNTVRRVHNTMTCCKCNQTHCSPATCCQPLRSKGRLPAVNPANQEGPGRLRRGHSGSVLWPYSPVRS
jgi:hypothetical protein